MNIYACFCDVGHRADGVYVAKSKKLKGWGIVFCKQKIVNILQTEDWEILASDRS